jgi:hypothetical protein
MTFLWAFDLEFIAVWKRSEIIGSSLVFQIMKVEPFREHNNITVERIINVYYILFFIYGSSDYCPLFFPLLQIYSIHYMYVWMYVYLQLSK